MTQSEGLSYRQMLISGNRDSRESTVGPYAPDASILAKIEASRRELLDLGLRNPLLNYRTLRAKGVDIVGESAAQVFQTLVADGRSMSFLPGGEDGDGERDGDNPYARPAAANQSDRNLQTGVPADDLQKRLLNTFRDANTSLQETGVNTLFLALGMLRWYEADSSGLARYAPLVLVPVKLERTGARERFTIEYTGDDLGVNLSLIEKAGAEFGLSLPGRDALEPDDSDMDAAGYITEVADVVSRSAPQRWVVEPDRIALGFFSFNKLLMYLDLGDSAVAGNEIIAALFGDGFREPPSDIADGDHLDDRISPQDTYHVLDADSSQSLAIYDATGGRNLVIQGPPGTGKSQTITNIIAGAVGRGQKVLFVSEKMAALEVVKRRLDNIGLGGACLELHSHKTNKRQTLDELSRTLNPQDSGGPSQRLQLDDLARVRNRLNEYSQAVNTPVGQSGVTPHDAIGERLRLTRNGMNNPIDWQRISGIQDWSGDDYRRKREVVDELRQRLQRTRIPSQHPFYGCRLQSLLPAAQPSLREKIETASRALTALEDSSAALAVCLNLPPPDNIAGISALMGTGGAVADAPEAFYEFGGRLNLAAPQWQSHSGQIKELLEVGLRWRQIRAEYDALLLPDAWNADFRQTRQVLNTTGRSFWGRLFSSAYRQSRRRLAAVLRGELPGSVDRQIALLDAIAQEREMRADLDQHSGGKYAEAAFVLGRYWAGAGTDWDALAPAVNWWLDLLDRSAAGLVPPDAVRILQSGPEVNHRRDLPSAIDQLRESLNAYRSGIAELQSALELDNELRFANPDGLISLAFADQRGVLSQWAARLQEIQDIIGFNNGVAAAAQENLHPAVDAAQRNPDAAELLTVWLERAWYDSIVETAFAERPALREFDGSVHESRIAQFRDMDQNSLHHNRARVAQAHRETAFRPHQLPERLVRASGGDDDGETRERQQQLRILRREIEKRTRHKPIRRLLAEAGDIIQQLKPVFMMSPLSIANYLEPGGAGFDLVVFDEASQVRPVDALGSLLRGKKAVVVGDSRQMPPTSFFESISHGDESADDDESVTADIESVLDLFASQGAPSRTLRWHYRSRHESLIAVSNREFYDNGLVVFSSPDAGRETLGLRYHHLPDAVYDRGRSRTNPIEAETVARAVMEHAARCPELSLGVAAFSQSQAQAIDDRLEILRRQDDSAEGFFHAHPEEPFFVKNLENVQGDERDVIFISIGYGREENGRVYQNFGPLNREGGERRLNVLITRAKRQCHVFTNLHSDDISAASESRGMQALRTFLAYAETGRMPDNPLPSSTFQIDSPFQEEVTRRLEQRGYQVHQEVASGGRFVDIGIVDPQRPGRYIIGIECDGASYHSSRSARDRDRLREQLLTALGWKLHRIWSTDWFHNPERELERAVAAIESAKRSG